MRFSNLGKEATQSLWGRWKNSIFEILDEFNNDVFGGRCSLRENMFGGKPCILLETKKESLCVFPYSGLVLAFGLYRRNVTDQKSRSKPPVFAPCTEDLIFWTGLDTNGLESPQKSTQLFYLERVIKRLYQMHWLRLLT